MSDSPDAFSVLLTSSARVAIVSARRLDVSMMFSVRSCARVVKLSVSSCERPLIMSRIASDFSEKPSVTRSSRAVIMSSRPPAISANSSVTWSALKLRLRVSCSLAVAIAREVSSLAVSRRSIRSPPRSLNCCTMLSPTRPSASVMCSPFSASDWVMLCAASLTCWPTRSLIVDRSCVRSMWTLLMAERTCSAWATRVSRWLTRSLISPRTRTSLSL